MALQSKLHDYSANLVIAQKIASLPPFSRVFNINSSKFPEASLRHKTESRRRLHLLITFNTKKKHLYLLGYTPISEKTVCQDIKI
jgi:hypothetical protein